MFLSVTKLFSNSDVNLRRMMYLCMKELVPDAPEVMIVINSLTKDMNAPQELYRANAIRVLRKMLDPSMLQQIERYFKQCIVDKSPVRTAIHRSPVQPTGVRHPPGDARRTPDLLQRASLNACHAQRTWCTVLAHACTRKQFRSRWTVSAGGGRKRPRGWAAHVWR